MSYIPFGGYKPVPDYELVKNGKEDYYWGMGLTAEARNFINSSPIKHLQSVGLHVQPIWHLCN